MRWNRIRLVALLLVGIALVSAASTYFDVLAHKHTLRADLVRRTQWFGNGLQPQIEQQFVTGDKVDWAGLLKNLRQHPDEPSLTVLDAGGNVLASDGDTPAWDKQRGNLIRQTLAKGKEVGAFVHMPPVRAGSAGGQGADTSPRLWYEDVMPLHAGGRIAGAVLMTADA